MSAQLQKRIRISCIKCDFVTEITDKSGYNKGTKKRKDVRKMSALRINKNNFDLVINSDKPVLLDFYAEWCGPCRMVSPIVEQIAAENPQYLVAKVNVDEEPELAAQFGVASIPTLAVIKDGRIISKSSGAKPKQQILKMLES